MLSGSLDAGRRGARRIAPVGSRAVGLTLWPAVQVYESPPVSRARARAAELSAAATRDGRDLVDRTGAWARATSSDLFRQLISAILSNPATETLLDEALADPAVERLATRVLDSALVDHLTKRLLDSDEMQLVLEHVTRSPELRAAVSRQTAGLAEDVAGGVRSRTAVADMASERMAQQFIRRLRGPKTSQP